MPVRCRYARLGMLTSEVRTTFVLPFPAALPAWRLGGPTLAYAAPRPGPNRTGALYRDTLWGAFVARERYRNRTSRRLDLGLALTNPAPFAVRVLHFTPATERARSVLLPPGAHALWATPLGAGKTGAVVARGRAVVALGPLAGLPAPLVVTLYAAPGVPAAPSRLPLVRRGSGVRATFAHADMTLTLVASRSHAVSLWPAHAPLPSLPAVDSVDGRTAWADGAKELLPRLNIRLPGDAGGHGWHLTLRTGAKTRTLARYGPTRRPERHRLVLPAAALGADSRVTLAPVRTPPRPSP